MKNVSQHSRSPGRDLIPGSSECEAEVNQTRDWFFSAGGGGVSGTQADGNSQAIALFSEVPVACCGC
jgi:hypothetical protein